MVGTAGASPADVGRPDRRPDRRIASVAGAYAAALVAPIAVTVARRAGLDAAGLLAVAFAAGGLAIVVGAVLFRRRVGLDVRLGATPWAWLLVVAPLASAGALLVALDALGRPGAVGGEASAIAGPAGWSAAALVGFVLVAMAKTRYAARIVDAASVEAAWSAPWPPRRRRQLRLVAAGVAFASLVALAMGTYYDRNAVRFLGLFALSASAILATVGRKATYRATAPGLEIRAGMVRRFVPWSALDGYRLTDDELALIRRGRHRTAFRCDRAAIEDPDAVAAALETHLARRS